MALEGQVVAMKADGAFVVQVPDRRIECALSDSIRRGRVSVEVTDRVLVSLANVIIFRYPPADVVNAPDPASAATLTRALMIERGIIRPTVQSDNPTPAEWVDKPTLRMDRLGLEEARRPLRAPPSGRP